MYFRARLPQPV